MEMIRQGNPKRAVEIESYGYLLRVHNMIVEAKSLGLTINAEMFDVETISALAFVKLELEKRASKKVAGARRG